MQHGRVILYGPSYQRTHGRPLSDLSAYVSANFHYGGRRVRRQEVLGIYGTSSNIVIVSANESFAVETTMIMSHAWLREISARPTGVRRPDRNLPFLTSERSTGSKAVIKHTGINQSLAPECHVGPLDKAPADESR